jgi:hypothetical protein
MAWECLEYEIFQVLFPQTLSLSLSVHPKESNLAMDFSLYSSFTRDINISTSS